jgi:hypothetical protein
MSSMPSREWPDAEAGVDASPVAAGIVHPVG